MSFRACGVLFYVLTVSSFATNVLKGTTVEDFKEVKFGLEQGEILVNDGYETPVECKVLVFDLASKYAEVIAVVSDECPTVLLWATDSTLRLDESKKGRPTEIKLHDYKGWDVLMASVGRYSLTVVLEKRN